MAVKKRKTASKKVSAKNAAQKALANKIAAKKPVAKKAAKKTSVRKTSATAKASVKPKTAAKSSPAKPRKKATSVDSILKRYQKERVTKESKLVSVRSEIKDLNSKIQAYQNQIVKLKAEQLDTENSICTLDVRRDQEVAELLSSLGVNLDSIASAGDAANKKKVDKPTPLFDVAQSTDDKSGNDEMSQDELEMRARKKPTVDVLIAGEE